MLAVDCASREGDVKGSDAQRAAAGTGRAAQGAWGLQQPEEKAWLSLLEPRCGWIKAFCCYE